MKTKKILKWFLGLSLGFGSVISIPIALTSCGSSVEESNSVNIGDYVEVEVYDGVYRYSYRGFVCDIDNYGITINNTLYTWEYVNYVRVI